jgi:hypothetical protein
MREFDEALDFAPSPVSLSHGVPLDEAGESPSPCGLPYLWRARDGAGGDSHVLIPVLEKAEDRTVRRLQAAGIKLFGGVEGAKAKLYIISMTWKLFEEATRRFRATECVG